MARTRRKRSDELAGPSGVFTGGNKRTSTPTRSGVSKAQFGRTQERLGLDNNRPMFLSDAKRSKLGALSNAQETATARAIQEGGVFEAFGTRAGSNKIVTPFLGRGAGAKALGASEASRATPATPAQAGARAQALFGGTAGRAHVPVGTTSGRTKFRGGTEDTLNPLGLNLSKQDMLKRSGAMSGRGGRDWKKIRDNVLAEQAQATEQTAATNERRVADEDLAKTQAREDELIRLRGEQTRETRAAADVPVQERADKREARMTAAAEQKKIVADMKLNLATPEQVQKRKDYLMEQTREMQTALDEVDPIMEEKVLPEGSVVREVLEAQLLERHEELADMDKQAEAAPAAALDDTSFRGPIQDSDLNSDGTTDAADETLKFDADGSGNLDTNEEAVRDKYNRVKAQLARTDLSEADKTELQAYVSAFDKGVRARLQPKG